jgi:nucleoside 2-deoxyribosyltransferase
MRIYLAGPDVFLPEAEVIATAKKAICARHGMTGIFPLDPIQDAAAEAASDRFMKIYLWNEAHIRSCDALVANLTPFRGPSADAGTVFELGFMRALGRPVFGYANTSASFRDRTLAFLGATARPRPEAGEWEDAAGLHLENFGLQDNLMIDGGILASGGRILTRAVPEERRWSDLGAFEDCIAALAASRRD